MCFQDWFARQMVRLNTHGSLGAVAGRYLIFGHRGAATGLSPHRLSHDALRARPWNGFYVARPSSMGCADWFCSYRYQTPQAVLAEDQELLLPAYPDGRFAVPDEVQMTRGATS